MAGKVGWYGLRRSRPPIGTNCRSLYHFDKRDPRRIIMLRCVWRTQRGLHVQIEYEKKQVEASGSEEAKEVEAKEELILIEIGVIRCP